MTHGTKDTLQEIDLARDRGIIPLFDIVMGITHTMDLASEELVDHHKRVAYIAYSIAKALNFPKEQQNDIILAGLMHDIGAFSLKERLGALRFEMTDGQRHAKLGYMLVKKFEPFESAAQLIKCHHAMWNDRRDERIATGCYILHLADRAAVLMDDKKPLSSMIRDIHKRLKANKGTMFCPELLDVFIEISGDKEYWSRAFSPSVYWMLSGELSLGSIKLDIKGLKSLAQLFCQIIDFRSRFTATHSRGVAVSARILSELMGFSNEESLTMEIAGYLHDLGKIAIPSEILDKPGKLTPEEYRIIKTHTLHTHNILENMRDLDTVKLWASLHHERLDGRGYPFGLVGDQLSMGSRIMAVADVFTAITEDRPYRKGMTSQSALEVMDNMVDSSALDGYVVSVLKRNYDYLNFIRAAAQREAALEYGRFQQQIQ